MQLNFQIFPLMFVKESDGLCEVSMQLATTHYSNELLTLTSAWEIVSEAFVGLVFVLCKRSFSLGKNH